MTPTPQELAMAYEACRRVTKSEARNFYYAFQTLPTDKRRAIHAAYAFCRLCDDLADDDLPHDARLAGLRRVRRGLRRAQDGRYDSPMFLALADAARRYDIPWGYFSEILDGVEMDLSITRYATFEELREYCYKVACVVGLVSVRIFGHEATPDVERRAIDLGLAMQLTNILRDVPEDAGRGRVYLPQEAMRQAGYTEEELAHRVLNDQFRALMRRQIARTRELFESGRRLIPRLSPDSRACVATLIAVYSRLLDRIEASDCDVFSRRVSLSAREKLMMAARLWTLSRLPFLQRLI